MVTGEPCVWAPMPSRAPVGTVVFVAKPARCPGVPDRPADAAPAPFWPVPGRPPLPCLCGRPPPVVPAGTVLWPLGPVVVLVELGGGEVVEEVARGATGPVLGGALTDVVVVGGAKWEASLTTGQAHAEEAAP